VSSKRRHRRCAASRPSARSGDDGFGALETGDDGVAIQLSHAGGGGFVTVNAQPPGDDVAVGHYEARRGYGSAPKLS